MPTMGAITSVCETVSVSKEPSDRLTQAVKARDRAKKAYEERLAELGEVIADEARSGVMLTKIAKAIGNSVEHVRRQVRAHGVEGDPSRVPPPPPPRLTDATLTLPDGTTATVQLRIKPKRETPPAASDS